MKVSPTEPIPFSKLGASSSLPERHGVDFFWVGNGRTWGIQRKRFPEDYLASLSDGRLAKELAQMQSLDHPIVLLEGLGVWTNDGYLLDQKFHASQLYGWMLSCFFEKGVAVFQVRSERDALFFIDRVEAWSLRKSHHSLSRRPKPKGNMWGQKDSKDWGIHLLQSFDGIGPATAEAIFVHFNGIPLAWTATEEELIKVAGVGRGTAQKLLNTL